MDALRKLEGVRRTRLVALVAFTIYAFGFSGTVRGTGQESREDSSGLSNQFIAENDVTWTTLGTNENDSMPIGNGDLAANVWTEQNGDLVLLVAKADAWTELGKLVKLSRVRVKLSPNPFVGASNFTQVLELEKGAIEIKSGANAVQVWIDANHPVIHVETHLENPGSF